MIEIQRNGKYRVWLDEDPSIELHDLANKELAEAIDRMLFRAYSYGTKNPEIPWPSSDED